MCKTKKDRFQLPMARCTLWCALAYAMCIAMAYAQSVTPSQTFDIHMPAQPLATALTELSKQTGVQILAADDLVAGKSAPAVSGRMTAHTALEQLLTGSGLQVVSVGQDLVVQHAAPSPPGSQQAAPQDQAMTLPQVTVQDSREQKYAATSATTATKLDTPILDIPQSIQVLPRQVIDEQRAITLSDVFRNVSSFSQGVTSQSQRFGDRNVIFRGFTGNNYYTNGYKDPFNGSSFTFGLANIDRVEVLKGPSSVLYGPGEPGATINIITKQPLAEWYASGSLTGGSFGFVNPSLDVSGPLTPGKELRFRLNAAYQQ